MDERAKRKKKLPHLPQGRAGWREVALRYLERFEAPAARVERVLQDRARRHGALTQDVMDDIEAVVMELCKNKIIDDQRYSEMRVSGLQRRGMGYRAIVQDLHARGIKRGIVQEAVVENEFFARQSVITAARKKRLGPFRIGRNLERWNSEPAKQRQRELAALARLGHGFEDAAYVIDGESEEQLLEWLAEKEGL